MHAGAESLVGRAAVVTGTATGIGQTLAMGLAEVGVQVAGIDISDQGKTTQAIADIGGTFLPLCADMTDPAAIRTACDRADREFGTLEIVVANAAIMPSAPIEDVTLEEWRRTMTVNLDGTFLTVQAALPHLKRAGWGRIVVMSSATIRIGVPTLVPYITTKAGLIGFTRALASEVGEFGITVNAITPGLTETENVLGNQWEVDQFDWVVAQQIIKRRQQPRDIVSALLFLCDPGSDFVTGQTINVDGGKTKH